MASDSREKWVERWLWMNKIVVHSYVPVIDLGQRCASTAELEVMDGICPNFVHNFEFGGSGLPLSMAAIAKRS
ncbi:hypothetical protein [Rhodococcoides fascians]|uniref:hypothetical protein n=1 Tax=Rhodococcoides fascians TaxID=1828 RepID=UPI0012D2E345|nr:hypothetical protein [Rhodococcus fascians]